MKRLLNHLSKSSSTGVSPQQPNQVAQQTSPRTRAGSSKGAGVAQSSLPAPSESLINAAKRAICSQTPLQPLNEHKAGLVRKNLPQFLKRSPLSMRRETLPSKAELLQFREKGQWLVALKQGKDFQVFSLKDDNHLKALLEGQLYQSSQAAHRAFSGILPSASMPEFTKNGPGTIPPVNRSLLPLLDQSLERCETLRQKIAELDQQLRLPLVPLTLPLPLEGSSASYTTLVRACDEESLGGLRVLLAHLLNNLFTPPESKSRSPALGEDSWVYKIGLNQLNKDELTSLFANTYLTESNLSLIETIACDPRIDRLQCFCLMQYFLELDLCGKDGQKLNLVHPTIQSAYELFYTQRGNGTTKS